MASARKLYTAFHHEAPREAYRLTLDWPDHPVRVGIATAIVYRSDKWHDGIHDYEHRIDADDAEVICDRSLRDFGDLRRVAARKVCLASPPATSSRIGDAVELRVRRDDGRIVTASFGGGPRLYDSPEIVTFDRGGLHYYVWPSHRRDRAKAVIVRSRSLVITPGGLDG